MLASFCCTCSFWFRTRLWHHCNIIRSHIKGGLFWAAGRLPRPPCSQGLSATRFSCTRTLPSRTSAPHTRGLSPTMLVWLVVLCSTTGKPKGEEGEPCTKSRDTAWSSGRCTRDQENKLESCRWKQQLRVCPLSGCPPAPYNWIVGLDYMETQVKCQDQEPMRPKIGRTLSAE